MLWTKEHYELLDQFERTHKACRLDKEAKELWPKGIVYQDGRVNELFLAYRNGCAYGRTVERLASEVPMREILVLQQIREAIGDPHGKLMQDEVVEAVKKLAEDAERLDWLEDRINADGEIHLHDGAHARGTGLGLRPGTMNRTLRQAIDTARGKA